MRKIIFCLLLVVSVFMSNLSYGQGVVVEVNGEVVMQMGNVSDGNREKEQEKRITVSGTVTCQGEPVNNVSVWIKGTDQAPVYTNMNGEYKISIPKNGATLVFSELALIKKYVEVKDQTVVNVDMEEDPLINSKGSSAPPAKNMTVVTGYVTCGGDPIIGAYVGVKGKKIWTFTKWNGKYTIMVPKRCTLIYSFVDETIELKIKGRSRIDVQLDGNNMILDGSEYDRQIKKIQRSKKRHSR